MRDNTDKKAARVLTFSGAGDQCRQKLRALRPKEFALAKQELKRLSELGLKACYNDRYDFCVVQHGMYQKHRDSMFDLLRPADGFPHNRVVGESIFCDCTIMDILQVCFTPEASAFLVEHTYNNFLFWQYMRTIVSGFARLFTADKARLPYTLDAVRERLLTDLTPFGSAGSPYSELHMSRLRQAVEAAGGQFDPNRLGAAYAFDLIRHGFLLRQRMEDDKQPSVLVVNPIWQHLLADDSVMLDGVADSTPA